jgi:hypothetical protein
MSTRKLMGRTHCTLAFSFFILIIPAIGQVRSGTINGSVEDSSGATVTDANVTVTDTGTNISYFAAYSSGRLKAQKTIRFALGPSIKVSGPIFDSEVCYVQKS